METFPAEWQAGYVWTVSRPRTKACRLSEHFRLRILPPGNLRLFRFPFQHVSKELLPQRFRAPTNNRSRAVTSSVSNSRNSSSMRSSAPRSREARPASRRNSFENSTIAYRHRSKMSTLFLITMFVKKIPYYFIRKRTCKQ